MDLMLPFKCTITVAEQSCVACRTCQVETSPRKLVNCAGAGYSSFMWLFHAYSIRLLHSPCAKLIIARHWMGTERASVLRGNKAGEQTANEIKGWSNQAERENRMMCKPGHAAAAAAAAAAASCL